MAGFNGAGTFVRTYSWANDKTNGVNITASRFDTEDSGFATGLSTCICKDGQQTTTAIVPFAVGVSCTAGSISAPMLMPIGDLTTGVYSSASGKIDISSTGTRVGGFNSGGLDNTVIGAGTPLAGTFTTVAGTAITASTTLAATGNFSVNTNKFNVTASNGNTTAAGTLVVTGALTAGGVAYPASNGTNLQFLQTNGSGTAAWASPKSVLTGGSNAAITAGSTIFMFAGSSATENQISLPLPAGTLQTLQVQASAAPGAAKNYVATVRKNGVDTTLTCTINGASTSYGSDITHTVAYSIGDVMSVKIVTDAASATANFNFSAQLASP